MKSTIHFPIIPDSKLLVEAGDSLDPETVIMEETLEQKIEIIPIAGLLHVQNSTFTRYLIKKIGDDVSKGGAVAKKKGILSSRQINSPVSGKITGINLHQGTLTISGKSQDRRVRQINIPVKSKVKSITKTYIEIEVEGEVCHVTRGEGKDIMGKLEFFGEKVHSTLDIPCDLEGCIAACSQFTDDAVVKLEVLEVLGLIVIKPPKKTDLPWVEVREEILKKLSRHNGKRVWLKPKEKEIVIFE